MDDLARLALDAATDAGAAYADVRAVAEETEEITVSDQRVEGVARQTTRGVGVRVLVDGAWGFAATARLEREQVLAAARQAVEVARASATAQGEPVRLAPLAAEQGTWRTPLGRDPMDVALEEKLQLLLATTAAAHEVAGLAMAKATTDTWRTTKWFVSSEGAALHQVLHHVAAGAECTAIGDGEVQTRSFPNSFRGHCASGGWEDVLAMDLAGLAPRHAEEAVALLTAPNLPSDITTVVLDGNQLALQVHESVGHPLELDRILGWEAAYAGTSFVGAGDVRGLRYGSDRVNLVLDTTTPGALGTYGWDDEGVPAMRAPLVTGGILHGLLTSRETAGALGPHAISNGTMRADSWAAIPLIRMTNIHLEPDPDGPTLEELLSDTGEGVFLTTNSSWSIDDKRVNFQFGCEVAYEIKDGRLGRRFRNPTYAGRTTDFWGSCDAICGPAAWQVYGTPNCGKGQPAQVARVAHGTAPARFRDVQVGVR